MSILITARRSHEIDMGHTVTGHEGKCKQLHGHRYRFIFDCTAPELDPVGRVIDFGVIKSILCEWLETHWDHRFMVWEGDKRAGAIARADDTVLVVDFNPTAENIAAHFISNVAPGLLADTDVTLASLTLYETSKCSVTVTLGEKK